MEWGKYNFAKPTEMLPKGGLIKYAKEFMVHLDIRAPFLEQK